MFKLLGRLFCNQKLIQIEKPKPLSRSLKEIDFTTLQPKELALLSKQMLKERRTQQIHWHQMFQQLKNRMLCQKIDPRSSSSLLLNISKSKQVQLLASFRELQVPVYKQLMSSPDPRHVTQYIQAFSRHKGCSKQFLLGMEKVVLQNGLAFNERQLVSCLYSLVRSGGQPNALQDFVVQRFEQHHDRFNLNQICTMSRALMPSGKALFLNLQLVEKLVALRMNECNSHDFTDLCELLFRSGYSSTQFYNTLSDVFQILKYQLGAPQIMRIFKFIHRPINGNLITITMMEGLIKKLRILAKKGLLSKTALQQIKQQFKAVNNMQLKMRVLEI